MNSVIFNRLKNIDRKICLKQGETRIFCTWVLQTYMKIGVTVFKDNGGEIVVNIKKARIQKWLLKMSQHYGGKN